VSRLPLSGEAKQMTEAIERQSNRPVMQFCSTCGAMADYWVTEDNRIPRPICGRCLGRLQAAMARADAEKAEQIAHAARKKIRRAQKAARRASRRG